MRFQIKTYTYILSFIFALSTLFAQDKNFDEQSNFRISDPPMFFIHHFVTLDSKNIESISEPSGKKIIQSLDEGITNPQILSTMITTAIGKWGQVKIAGESIQRRLDKENIIDLMKSYDYPNETDYIIIGELNTLSNNYEIDLKVMNVSTQDIILSDYFTIDKDDLNKLRALIEYRIYLFLDNLLKPFVGFLAVKVDDSSRDFINWENISIRALETKVGGKVKKTENKNLRNISFIEDRNNNKNILNNYFSKLSELDYSDISVSSDRGSTLGLLEGNYELVALLDKNKENFKTTFEITTGKMTLVEIKIDYLPPPVPKIIEPPTGSISIKNLFEGVNVSISKIDELFEKQVNFTVKNNELIFDFKNNIDYVRDGKNLLLKNFALGEYSVGAYTISNETFPGKYYTILYSFEDILQIEKRSQVLESNLPEAKTKTGREIVIYFNPFPETKNEKYEIYLDKSKTPFSVVSNVGEVHIIGVPYNFSGTITAKEMDI